jgi:RNA polymerase sigma factor (TIGR02999 family)
MNDFTQRLEASVAGKSGSAGDILPLVYAELRKRAAALMANERPDHTLQPTALVHEAWLRLVDRSAHTWKNRAHFFACAAEAMRWVLVDHARRKRAHRRGGDFVRVDFSAASDTVAIDGADGLLALNAALERLQKLHPKKAELIKLRFFAGLTLEEAGKLIGISEPTAKRHWAFARAWLFKEMRRDAGH